MKHAKISILLSLLSVFVMVTPAWACAQPENSGPAQESLSHFEKVYVTPEQVVLVPEGIFFLSSEGILTAARLISVDAQGMYVVKAYYRCSVCGRMNIDNICWNSSCTMFGL